MVSDGHFGIHTVPSRRVVSRYLTSPYPRFPQPHLTQFPEPSMFAPKHLRSSTCFGEPTGILQSLTHRRSYLEGVSDTRATHSKRDSILGHRNVFLSMIDICMYPPCSKIRQHPTYLPPPPHLATRVSRAKKKNTSTRSLIAQAILQLQYNFLHQKIHQNQGYH